jgi:hypothetical protein
MTTRFMTILTGRDLPTIWQARKPQPSIINEKTVADFTRVVEQNIAAPADGAGTRCGSRRSRLAMAAKHHPTPLSGGDRKALQKEPVKARAMTGILASQSADKRRVGEALIREADSLACQSWNERMWSDGGPAQPSQTIGQAINGGFPPSNSVLAPNVSQETRARHQHLLAKLRGTGSAAPVTGSARWSH